MTADGATAITGNKLEKFFSGNLPAFGCEKTSSKHTQSRNFIVNNGTELPIRLFLQKIAGFLNTIRVISENSVGQCILLYQDYTRIASSKTDLMIQLGEFMFGLCLWMKHFDQSNFAKYSERTNWLFLEILKNV